MAWTSSTPMPRHITPLRLTARCGVTEIVGNAAAADWSHRDIRRLSPPPGSVGRDDNAAASFIEFREPLWPKDFNGMALDDGEPVNIAFIPCVSGFGGLLLASARSQILDAG
jgi:hypothetical protein